MGQFGEIIRKRREELGLTLREVAEATGLTTGYLSALETGLKPPPSPSAVKAIAKALGLNTSSLSQVAIEEKLLYKRKKEEARYSEPGIPPDLVPLIERLKALPEDQRKGIINTVKGLLSVQEDQRKKIISTVEELLSVHSVGEKIRKAREAKKWTVEYLADKIGTNPAYLRKLEEGEKPLRLTLIRKLSYALGLPPEELCRAAIDEVRRREEAALPLLAKEPKLIPVKRVVSSADRWREAIGRVRAWVRNNGQWEEVCGMASIIAHGEPDGSTYALTCDHLFDGEEIGPIELELNGRKFMAKYKPFKYKPIKEMKDLALLEISDKVDVPGLPLAREGFSVGEEIALVTEGEIKKGEVLGPVPGEEGVWDIGIQASKGLSGSPLIDTKGHIKGVLIRHSVCNWEELFPVFGQIREAQGGKEKGEIKATSVKGLNERKTLEINYFVPEGTFVFVELFFDRELDLSSYEYLAFRAEFEGEGGEIKVELKTSELEEEWINKKRVTFPFQYASAGKVYLLLDNFLPPEERKRAIKLTFVFEDHRFKGKERGKVKIEDIRFIRGISEGSSICFKEIFEA